MLRNISLGLIVAALAACGSARVIQKTQTGGTIELSGDRGKAMEQANQDMATHCGPNNFTIQSEGEEAIGTDTYTQENTATDSKTSKNGRREATDTTTQNQQSTRTATAWRVHYLCNGVAGAPPPGGPAAGGPPPPPPPGGDAPPPPPPPGGGY